MLKRRRLPHLDVPGRPQFVTFRLYGSLPENRAFPPGSLTSGEAFVAMDRLLDQGLGCTFLRQSRIAELVEASIQQGSRMGHYETHAWVIMPNHVHLLITPKMSLSAAMRSLKGVTARRANGLLGRSGKRFWQDESYDHLVRNEEEFRNIKRYIENNPVKACLAHAPERYRWSSAGAA